MYFWLAFEANRPSILVLMICCHICSTSLSGSSCPSPSSTRVRNEEVNNARLSEYLFLFEHMTSLASLFRCNFTLNTNARVTLFTCIYFLNRASTRHPVSRFGFQGIIFLPWFRGLYYSNLPWQNDWWGIGWSRDWLMAWFDWLIEPRGFINSFIPNVLHQQFAISVVVIYQKNDLNIIARSPCQGGMDSSILSPAAIKNDSYISPTDAVDSRQNLTSARKYDETTWLYHSTAQHNYSIPQYSTAQHNHSTAQPQHTTAQLQCNVNTTKAQHITTTAQHITTTAPTTMLHITTTAQHIITTVQHSTFTAQHLTC